jgi:mRNA interferase MazF
MKRTLPGEIWRVDFGLAAKVRPALILSYYPSDDELALLVVIPHTTAVRGNRWEMNLPNRS